MFVCVYSSGSDNLASLLREPAANRERTSFYIPSVKSHPSQSLVGLNSNAYDPTHENRGTHLPNNPFKLHHGLSHLGQESIAYKPIQENRGFHQHTTRPINANQGLSQSGQESNVHRPLDETRGTQRGSIRDENPFAQHPAVTATEGIHGIVDRGTSMASTTTIQGGAHATQSHTATEGFIAGQGVHRGNDWLPVHHPSGIQSLHATAGTLNTQRTMDQLPLVRSNNVPLPALTATETPQTATAHRNPFVSPPSHSVVVLQRGSTGSLHTMPFAPATRQQPNLSQPNPVASHSSRATPHDTSSHTERFLPTEVMAIGGSNVPNRSVVTEERHMSVYRSRLVIIHSNSLIELPTGTYRCQPYPLQQWFLCHKTASI